MTFVWCLKFADCSSRHYFLSYAVLRSARQRSIDTHNCVCTPTVLLAREQAHFPGDTFPMPLFPVLFSPCDTSHAGRFPQGPFTIEPVFPTSLFPRAVTSLSDICHIFVKVLHRSTIANSVVIAKLSNKLTCAHHCGVSCCAHTPKRVHVIDAGARVSTWTAGALINVI